MMDIAGLASRWPSLLLELALGLARAAAWAMALAVGLAAFGGPPGTAGAAGEKASPLPAYGSTAFAARPAPTPQTAREDR